MREILSNVDETRKQSSQIEITPSQRENRKNEQAFKARIRRSLTGRGSTPDACLDSEEPSGSGGLPSGLAPTGDPEGRRSLPACGSGRTEAHPESTGTGFRVALQQLRRRPLRLSLCGGPPLYLEGRPSERRTGELPKQAGAGGSGPGGDPAAGAQQVAGHEGL